LHESDGTPAQIPGLKKIKARIEIICDFEDLKRLTELLKALMKE
jgi:hypothetical protein